MEAMDGRPRENVKVERVLRLRAAFGTSPLIYGRKIYVRAHLKIIIEAHKNKWNHNVSYRTSSNQQYDKQGTQNIHHIVNFLKLAMQKKLN